MARTGIPTTGVTTAGASAPTPADGDPVNGNAVANPDGATLLLVRNTGVVTRTLTVRLWAKVDGQPVIPRTYAIPAGQARYLGSFHPLLYGTILWLDADSDDLELSAVRPGPDLPAPAAGAGVSPFSLDGLVVVADLDAAGLTLDGTVLVVDTDATDSTLDGNVLIVTV